MNKFEYAALLAAKWLAGIIVFTSMLLVLAMLIGMLRMMIEV